MNTATVPAVECLVRARIPTTSGTETFLHLYHNDADTKEHLAIVFGKKIRSFSLDRPREGETEYERMVRGAYKGRLRPGRLSSSYDCGNSSIAAVPENDRRSQCEIDSFEPDDCVNNDRRDKSVFSQLYCPLVRIHSECYTGETAWSARCDCGQQLDEAARLMSLQESTAVRQDAESPGGVIVYLRQEGRGIGLQDKLKAYNLQDLGSDTIEANLLLERAADARSYGVATAILMDLGLGTSSGCQGIRLLTNNPHKLASIEGPNKEIKVMERIAMVPLAWRDGSGAGTDRTDLQKYLHTKVSLVRGWGGTAKKCNTRNANLF